MTHQNLEGYEPVANPWTDPSVSCPACQRTGWDDTAVHIARVEVDRLGEVVEVDADGVGFMARHFNGQPQGGSVVDLEFWCEVGHRFTWRFDLECGQTAFSVREGEDFDPAETTPLELPRN